MVDPVSSLIGTLLIGFGTLLMVGAIKNRRVFGADGLVPQALAKGSITDLASVPQAFPAGGAVEESGARVGGRTERTIPTKDAVTAIAGVDASLAAQIGAEVAKAQPTSSRADLMPLAQLLALADVKGFTSSVQIIRAYIQELTGEQI